jgi:hypothetical protein
MFFDEPGQSFFDDVTTRSPKNVSDE